jgi:hypothetical protein
MSRFVVVAFVVVVVAAATVFSKQRKFIQLQE